LVLDTRTPQDFATGFIPKSINIGLSGPFAVWVGELIKDIQQPILLITEVGKEEESMIRLSRVGYDHTVGFLAGGVETWKKANRPLHTIPRLEAHQFDAYIESEHATLLDVRKENEYRSEHLVDSAFISLNILEEKLRTLDKEKQVSLFDATFETGLSSTSRLHDLFITLEGMTPAEYQNGGEQLTINYSFAPSIFGSLFIASTSKGICHLVFTENEDEALQNLRAKFPKAKFQAAMDLQQAQALQIFQRDTPNLNQIKLHLKGTEFQLKVWQSLLTIPMGALTTYGAIATQIENPKASRAVGTAIGSNPIAFLIPCHRVIQSSGVLGNYMWGATRKKAIIGWEGAQVYNEIELENGLI